MRLDLPITRPDLDMHTVVELKYLTPRVDADSSGTFRALVVEVSP